MTRVQFLVEAEKRFFLFATVSTPPSSSGRFLVKDLFCACSVNSVYMIQQFLFILNSFSTGYSLSFSKLSSFLLWSNIQLRVS
jgi:hypothetical protein